MKFWFIVFKNKFLAFLFWSGLIFIVTGFSMMYLLKSIMLTGLCFYVIGFIVIFVTLIVNKRVGTKPLKTTTSLDDKVSSEAQSLNGIISSETPVPQDASQRLIVNNLLEPADKFVMTTTWIILIFSIFIVISIVIGGFSKGFSEDNVNLLLFMTIFSCFLICCVKFYPKFSSDNMFNKMSNNNAEVSITVSSMSIQELTEKINSIIEQHGKLNRNNNDNTIISGVIGAGIGNMNPATIQIKFITKDDGIEVIISGSALEGLIKQHAGEKAVAMIKQGIIDALPDKVRVN